MRSRRVAAVRPWMVRGVVGVVALALLLACPCVNLQAAQERSARLDLLGTAETPAQPAAPASPATAADTSGGGLTDLQAIGYGCIAGAAVLMAVTAAAGATEVVQIFAGGALVPSSRLVLWTALAMGAAAQTCTATGLATPALVHAWDNIAGLWAGPAKAP